MFDPVKKRVWRGLTALVVAYALVLQAFLATSLASQAAAQDPSAPDALFIICSHDGSGGTQADDGVPRPDHVHCPACTLAACATALAPEPPSLSFAFAGQTQRTGFAPADSVSTFFPSRAGLSRAPPIEA